MSKPQGKSRDESIAACVCGEINTRHCPVHGQGESAATRHDTEESTARKLLREQEVSSAAAAQGRAARCWSAWFSSMTTILACKYVSPWAAFGWAVGLLMLALFCDAGFEVRRARR